MQMLGKPEALTGVKQTEIALKRGACKHPESLSCNSTNFT